MLNATPSSSSQGDVLITEQRRSRLDICFELMEVIWTKEDIKPTQLMYKANLSWKMLSDLLSYLSERGLVRTSRVGARRTYSLTEEGTSCLRRLHEARQALVPENIHPATGILDEPERVFSESTPVQVQRQDRREKW